MTKSNEVFSQGKIIGLAGIVVSAQANFLSLTNFALLFPQKVAPQTELHLCPLLTDCSSFYLWYEELARGHLTLYESLHDYSWSDNSGVFV